jgi:hypothetical protein
MIALMLVALSLGGADVTAVSQHRVDRLIKRCAANKVVKLLARNGNEVSMHPLIIARAPTAAESRKFECVLLGMKEMTDLHFGFIGNEAAPNGS